MLLIQLQPCNERLPDPARNQFRRGVFNRQDDTVLPWKDPTAVFKSGSHFAIIIGNFNLNHRVPFRQKDAVIQFQHERLKSVAESDKIEHIVIFVERAFNLRFDTPIVPVNTFADIPVKRYEMSSAEDERVLRDTDAPCFRGRFCQSRRGCRDE